MSTPGFRLLETMRWDGPAVGVALLGRHLTRLAASAAFFGFKYDERAARDALVSALGDAGEYPPPRRPIADAGSAGQSPSPERARGAWEGAPHRLRLLLDADGTTDVEATPLGPDDRMRNAVLHPEPVEADGPFWRHKTTHRPHYEAPYRQARAAGFDEAILLDRDGQVVEGTRTTVWVERRGRLLTPPLAAGGLPGVYRAHLLATHPDAVEAPLTAADLLVAEAVWLSNAVRGLFPVQLGTPGAR